jgi:hypothetical protein
VIIKLKSRKISDVVSFHDNGIVFVDKKFITIKLDVIAIKNKASDREKIYKYIWDEEYVVQN